MAWDSMVLKIVLPMEILLEQEGVTRLVVDTTKGSVGFLPLRLDCIALVVPGIIAYELKDGKERYAAVDTGILVKSGSLVRLAVRDGVVGEDLEELKGIIEDKFIKQSEEEQHIQRMLARLEGTLMMRATEGLIRRPH